MIKRFKINYLFLFLVFLSCKEKIKKKTTKQENPSFVKYAKGFDIIVEKGVKKLIIKTPYQNSKTQFKYTITNKIFEQEKDTKTNTILVPIKNIVPTSTTHIPMIELLEEEKTIVGFPFSKYISSKKTRARIEKGLVREIGKENAINTEILLDLQPELIIGYSLKSNDKNLNTLRRSGLRVIYNGDWLEETPLGRAEWIKFFGILYDKEKKADSIFKRIEQDYNNAKKLIENKKIKPTVLSGAIMGSNIWYLPAGKSFKSFFFKDAQLEYYWKNSLGNGSLSLSFETVLDKSKDADLWINPGYFSSKNQMLTQNQLYKEFKAFKTGNIYSSSLKKGDTGGILFYEFANTRPDLVLKDLIKIGYPSLLPNYNFTFFEKLE